VSTARKKALPRRDEQKRGKSRAAGSALGTRRRGEQLESAILEAAWDELGAMGYGNLTMDAVAERAGTSKPVLYRRWRTRAELVLAVLRAHSPMLSGPVPDTGSLRGDVLFLLRRMSQGLSRVGTSTLFGLLADLFADAQGFSRVRAHVLQISTEVMSGLLQRALARGEVSVMPLPPRILTLPVDLARHEILVSRGPVPDETLAEIVDEIFLPLVLRCEPLPPSAEK
jgi:AcrR family transcriptional regulator